MHTHTRTRERASERERVCEVHAQRSQASSNSKGCGADGADADTTWDVVGDEDHHSLISKPHPAKAMRVSQPQRVDVCPSDQTPGPLVQVVQSDSVS